MNQILLLEEIESCRKELINLCRQYGMNSEIVLKTSEKLDRLLNKYQGNSSTNS